MLNNINLFFQQTKQANYLTYHERLLWWIFEELIEVLSMMTGSHFKEPVSLQWLYLLAKC